MGLAAGPWRGTPCECALIYHQLTPGNGGKFLLVQPACLSEETRVYTGKTPQAREEHIHIGPGGTQTPDPGSASPTHLAV